MEELRYPTGRFQRPTEYGDRQRREYIDTIASTPARMREAVQGLVDAQLDTPYRPDGWTVRQIVHHVPDSHMNSYVRFRLALTEDTPTIKPYLEARWAELPDARTMPVAPSLELLDGLHQRWVTLLRAMSPADFSRTLDHPEHGILPLDFFLALYAYHGPHHVAQITGLRKRMGW